ncbi:MAG: cytochrome b [Beijerinckiaceae bacterium]|jgi:cytochrome b561|nr:cytochrome b [Beijerinckiaceae bacterium]MDO9441356.1 cytochrome b [Beijerinckiaceae bacterium]
MSTSERPTILRRAPESYSAASKWLHWLTAACIFFLIPSGLSLEHLPEGVIQNTFYDLHRSFGFVVLCLAILRVGVRLYYGAPAAYAGLTPFERIASQAAHMALYVLIFVTPMLGWAATSAYPVTVSVFWLFNLPMIAPANEDLFKTLILGHKIAAFTMAGVLAAHIGGALMHGFIKRDGVLARMLPDGFMQPRN